MTSEVFGFLEPLTDSNEEGLALTSPRPFFSRNKPICIRAIPTRIHEEATGDCRFESKILIGHRDLTNLHASRAKIARISAYNAEPTLGPYSVRSARMGSTEAARLAGRKHARIAAANRTTATDMNADTSSACTPNSMLCIPRPTK